MLVLNFNLVLFDRFIIKIKPTTMRFEVGIDIFVIAKVTTFKFDISSTGH